MHHRDLCVENLIYLSSITSFKTMYGFLVSKELEDKKTRAGIVEEADEHSEHRDHSHDDLLGLVVHRMDRAGIAHHDPFDHKSPENEEQKSPSSLATADRIDDRPKMTKSGQRSNGGNASASFSHSFEDNEVAPEQHEEGEEYQEVYGWNMALPQWFGTENSSNLTKCRMNQQLFSEQNEELIVAMYQDSLEIYSRFIRVASKDEINISGKMRKSLKKYDC